MPLLTLTNISKRFGPTLALDGVTMSLDHGEVHALVGENGAGKSTLMGVIAGAIRPDSGAMEIEVGAHLESYSPASPLDARRSGVALIHQELSLCPHMTVADNILMGSEQSRWGRIDENRHKARALEILESFSSASQRAIDPGARAGSLPIASRQVVEICRALAFRARIILMDEPTSSLPCEDVARLFGLIRRLRDQGIGVIYISHFLEEVREIADRCTVLRDGKSITTAGLESLTDGQLIRLMVGRPITDLYTDSHGSTGSELALEVRDLAVDPAVKRASFKLIRGEILGIAGLIGAGRTELVRALFGLIRARSGTVSIGDNLIDAGVGAPADRIAQGLGYLSEDRKGEGLATALSIADNVTMTRFSKCSRAGWLRLEEQAKQVEAWLKRIGIKARGPAQTVRALSGGNQQKVALARLLYQDADVLLLDEPTRGIDVASKAAVYDIVRECASRGKAILFVSSQIPELLGLCDRIAVMHRGCLSEARPVSEWTPELILKAAVGGEESAAEM